MQTSVVKNLKAMNIFSPQTLWFTTIEQDCAHYARIFCKAKREGVLGLISSRGSAIDSASRLLPPIPTNCCEKSHVEQTQAFAYWPNSSSLYGFSKITAYRSFNLPTGVISAMSSHLRWSFTIVVNMTTKCHYATFLLQQLRTAPHGPQSQRTPLEPLIYACLPSIPCCHPSLSVGAFQPSMKLKITNL